MTLLQHKSLYESTASWEHSAQKKFLGNAVVGSELRVLVYARISDNIACIRTERTPSGRRRAAQPWGRLRGWPWW
jgi:hypothetical protein